MSRFTILELKSFMHAPCIMLLNILNQHYSVYRNLMVGAVISSFYFAFLVFIVEMLQVCKNKANRRKTKCSLTSWKHSKRALAGRLTQQIYTYIINSSALV